MPSSDGTRAWQAATALVGVMPYGRETQLNRVGRAQVYPVLGRKVVEREQTVTVLGSGTAPPSDTSPRRFPRTDRRRVAPLAAWRPSTTWLADRSWFSSCTTFEHIGRLVHEITATLMRCRGILRRWSRRLLVSHADKGCTAVWSHAGYERVQSPRGVLPPSWRCRICHDIVHDPLVNGITHR